MNFLNNIADTNAMVARNRRSSEEKIRIARESLTTNISIAELCCKYYIQSQVFDQWKEKFIEEARQH